MGKIGRSYQRGDMAYAYRNVAAAYRQFRRPGFWTGVDEFLFSALRHKAVNAILALLGAAGFIGGLWTFWISL